MFRTWFGFSRNTRTVVRHTLRQDAGGSTRLLRLGPRLLDTAPWPRHLYPSISWEARLDCIGGMGWPKLLTPGWFLDGYHL